MFEDLNVEMSTEKYNFSIEICNEGVPYDSWKNASAYSSESRMKYAESINITRANSGE